VHNNGFTRSALFGGRKTQRNLISDNLCEREFVDQGHRSLRRRCEHD
jgi:hypothetical protein